MFLCCARNIFCGFFFSEQQLFHKKSSFSPRAPNSSKHKHLGTFWEPKITQNRFSLFLRPNRQKAPKTRFGRKSAIFCKKLCFLAPEAFILRPWRKCCSRQCFFRYSEAHFHPFRTFALVFAFFGKKVILSAKTGFERKK